MGYWWLEGFVSWFLTSLGKPLSTQPLIPAPYLTWFTSDKKPTHPSWSGLAMVHQLTDRYQWNCLFPFFTVQFEVWRLVVDAILISNSIGSTDRGAVFLRPEFAVTETIEVPWAGLTDLSRTQGHTFDKAKHTSILWEPMSRGTTAWLNKWWRIRVYNVLVLCLSHHIVLWTEPKSSSAGLEILHAKRSPSSSTSHLPTATEARTLLISRSALINPIPSTRSRSSNYQLLCRASLI